MSILFSIFFLLLVTRVELTALDGASEERGVGDVADLVGSELAMDDVTQSTVAVLDEPLIVTNDVNTPWETLAMETPVHKTKKSKSVPLAYITSAEEESDTVLADSTQVFQQDSVAVVEGSNVSSQGGLIAFVVVAGVFMSLTLAVYIFRKLKLKPSRGFRQRLDEEQMMIELEKVFI
jgi:hypothetical protein